MLIGLTELFCEVLDDYFLIQTHCHVTLPNYAESASSSGNILDLVMTNNDSLIEKTAVYPYTFYSDHFSVYFTVNNKFNTIRKVYCYGKADFDGLRNTLSYVSWDSFISCDDINSSVANFQDLVFASVDQHVPLMKLRRNSRPPWIDKAVMKLIMNKKAIWKRLKNNASLELTSKFIFLRKDTKKLISSNYCKYLKSLSDKLKNNPKKVLVISFTKIQVKEIARNCHICQQVDKRSY